VRLPYHWCSKHGCCCCCTPSALWACSRPGLGVDAAGCDRSPIGWLRSVNGRRRKGHFYQWPVKCWFTHSVEHGHHRLIRNEPIDRPTDRPCVRTWMLMRLATRHARIVGFYSTGVVIDSSEVDVLAVRLKRANKGGVTAGH
jgi:hypothetical protein